MRNLILYSAAYLDGTIAGPDHETDWLFTAGDYGYATFYYSIGTTVSGYNTYQPALSFSSFPYPENTNIVFSRYKHSQEYSTVKFIPMFLPNS